MRRTKRTLIVAVALVSLICAGLAFARWGHGKLDMGDHRGQEARQRGFNRLVEKLGLTEEQAEELKAMFDEHHQKMKELKDATRPVLVAVREELAKDESNEEELARLISQAKTIQEQMKAERDAFRARIDEFKAGLTVTQQAQFLLFEARMFGKMHRRAMMPGEGPPGAEEISPFTGK